MLTYIIVLLSFLNLDTDRYQVNSTDSLKFKFVSKFDDSFIHSGQISDIKIANYKNIVVADQTLGKIVVYDEDGINKRIIGQKGRGPGDIQFANSIFIEGATIYLYDFGLQRISSFDLETGDVLKTFAVPRKPGHIMGHGTLINSNKVLLNYAESFRAENLEMSQAGTFVIYNFKEDRFSSDLFTREFREYLIIVDDYGFGAGPMPFGKRNTIQIDGEGSFYWGYPSELNVEKWNGDKLIKRFQYLAEPVALKMSDFENYFFYELGVEDRSELRDIVSSGNADNSFIYNAQKLAWILAGEAEVPEFFPVYDWFVLCDEGNLWFALNTENREYYEILRLDPDGNEAGRGKLSKGVRFFTINGTSAYGTEEDPETGEKNIVRYSITFN